MCSSILNARRWFSSAAEEEDKVIDHNKLTYYELLGISPSADDKKLKFAYLKMAKKFHPDVYSGVNKDLFK